MRVSYRLSVRDGLRHPHRNNPLSFLFNENHSLESDPFIPSEYTVSFYNVHKKKHTFYLFLLRTLVENAEFCHSNNTIYLLI